MTTFVAIDFETANAQRNSACQVGIARMENGTQVDSASMYIQPPDSDFGFFQTQVHGITWQDVQNQPTFPDVWSAVVPYLSGAEFLVAHNMGFDGSVIQACCDHYGLAEPDLARKCSVQIARGTWNVYPTTLPDVCRYLRVPLVGHHDAEADAIACATITQRAIDQLGWAAFLRQFP